MLFVTVYKYLKCWNVYQSKPIQFICCFFFQQTVVIVKNFLVEKVLPNPSQQNQFLQGWNLSIQKLQLEHSLLENVGKMEKKILISKNRTVVCQNFTNGVSNYVSKDFLWLSLLLLNSGSVPSALNSNLLNSQEWT